MCSSDFGPTIARSGFDLSRPCSTMSGRARFSIPLGWCMAALGSLACGVVYLSVDATRAVAKMDRNLVGMHPTWVESVAFDPKSRWLASAGGDGSVYLWNVDEREPARALEETPGTEAAYCVAFTPDGRELVVGGKGGSITIWNLTSGNRRPTFRFGSQVTRCLAFTPDGRLLATGSTDHGIALWDAMTLEKERGFRQR